MYWSYLTSSENHSSEKILAFETSDDIEKLSKGYCELVIDNFFSSFAREYDAIFISEYCPTDEPAKKDYKFIIKFNDTTEAIKILNNLE